MKSTISKFALATVTALGLTFAASESRAQGYRFQESSHGCNQGYSAAHQSLGQNIMILDRYADQMSNLYASEVRYYRGCGHAAALLSEMGRYHGYTHDLISAYRGTCPKTFARAACTVRDSLNRIEALQKRARVSNNVGALIARSCPVATYIHSNTGAFQPVIAPAQRQRGYGTPAPTYTNYNRGNSSNDIRAAIFGSIASQVFGGR